MSTTTQPVRFQSSRGHTVRMTAAQRATLAKLRINHPRAHVSVPERQPVLPLIVIRLQWPGRSTRLVVHPDGRRYFHRTEVTDA